MASNNPHNVIHHPSEPQNCLKPAFPYLELRTDSSGQQYISRNSFADGVPQPIFYPGANNPWMIPYTHPSLSLGMHGGGRKRKVEDEEWGRRVRSGAPPSLALGMVENGDGMGQRAGDEDGTRSWGCARVFQAFAENACSSAPPEDAGVMAWDSAALYVTRERGGFEQENVCQPGANGGSNVFRFSLLPEMHGISPRYSEYETSNSSLSPKMHGTPPGYSGSPAMPRVGCAKRKRSEIEGAENEDVREQLNRSRSNATYVTELKAGRAKPQQLQTEAMDLSSSELPKLDPTIPTLSHNGLKLGQLLPCGEILGFIDLPPLAQLYDLYSISRINPPPEHAWIQHTWRTIQTSLAIRPPTWQHNYWYEEISKSGTAHKDLTFRAIKTFRDLAERLWQVERTQETLNLFQKEMDYTVLLLLVHRHGDDRVRWEQRLKVLFSRLDPALRPLARPPTPAPFSTLTHKLGVAPWLQTPHLPAVKEESPERRAVFTPWPRLMGPSARGSGAPETLAVKDEPMYWS